MIYSCGNPLLVVVTSEYVNGSELVPGVVPLAKVWPQPLNYKYSLVVSAVT